MELFSLLKLRILRWWSGVVRYSFFFEGETERGEEEDMSANQATQEFPLNTSVSSGTNSTSRYRWSSIVDCKWR